ncbi:hypothetical protein [Streptomyces phage phiScoe54]|nr:hypothetical protein [Streptomyces phage phiScoe54]
MSRVSRKDAERVLAKLREHFGDPSAFTLYDADHEEMAPGTWSIAEEGIYDWPMEAWQIEGMPSGVFLEPRNGWSLGIYPA